MNGTKSLNRNIDTNRINHILNGFSNLGENYTIFHALSELLSENSKQTVKQTIEMFDTVSMLRDINFASRPEDISHRGLDLHDVLGIIKPLVGDQFKAVDGIESVLRMLSYNNHNEANTYKRDPHIRGNKRSRTARNTGINKAKAVDIFPSDEKDDTSIIYNMLDALANRLSKNNN